jgi:hypothetical protein
MEFYLPIIIKVTNIEKKLELCACLKLHKMFQNNGVLLYDFAVEQQY